MFYPCENESVIHMIPGQGWRLVLAMTGEGGPRIFEEPLIAWAIVEMNARVDFGEGEKIQNLVPLIRDVCPGARGYVWEFSEWEDIGTVLVAPGEVRTPYHDECAVRRMEKVAKQREEKDAKYVKAGEMRREGVAYESIAKELGLPIATARAIALQVDRCKK